MSAPVPTGYTLTPAEQFDRRIRVACPSACREAEREEYIAEHGEEPPESDDYEGELGECR